MGYKTCVNKLFVLANFKTITAKHVMLTILSFVKQAISIYEVFRTKKRWGNWG